MKIMQLFSSTIGQKFLVAATGLFMVFFLLAHLAGNLEIFSGPNAVNQYAAFLQTIPKTIWTFRLVLLSAVVIHIWATISLTTHSRRARIHPYTVKRSRKATMMSRTMLISGLTILAFILYHLAHYTLGITNPEFVKLVDSQGRHHVYNMMVLGFSNALVAGFYVVAQILLAFHLSHGVSSAARTLGVTKKSSYDRIRGIGVAFALLIAVLYISIPVSVYFGFIPFDQ